MDDQEEEYSEPEVELLLENDSSQQEEVARRLKERVISIVLGNLFTIVIVGVLYLNYVLFESYLGVFLYSFLASEALWDTKVFIVGKLHELNDEKAVSPRDNLVSLFHFLNDKLKASPWIWVLIVFCALFGALLVPFLSLFAVFSSAGLGLIVYALDRQIFVLTRIHRLFFNDDTFVALLLILFLLVAGIVFTTWFAIFTANDVKDMLHWISQWFETKLLKGDWAQELWQSISHHGENALQNWLEDFEQQYVANTTYEPVFRWAVRYVEQTRALTSNGTVTSSTGVGTSNVASPFVEGGCVADGSALEDYWSWASLFSLPDWAANKSMAELIFILRNHTQEADLSSFTTKMQGVVMTATDRFWATTLFALSILLFVIDFGIRVAFFITITFILLSSQDNLLHDFLTGFFGGRKSAVDSEDVETEDWESRSDTSPRTGSVGLPAMINTNPYDGSDLYQLEHVLRRTIKGVLMLPVVMSSFHAALTFLLFKLLQIELQYLAASLSIFFTVFPIFYAHWVCLPWLLVYILNAQYTKAVLLFVLHYSLYSMADTWVVSKLREGSQKSQQKGTDHSKDAFLTGVSVFFGVTAFGAHGVLLGPLLVCLGLVSYDLLRDQQNAVHAYFSAPSSRVASPQAVDTRIAQTLSRQRSNISNASSTVKTNRSSRSGLGVKPSQQQPQVQLGHPDVKQQLGEEDRLQDLLDDKNALKAGADEGEAESPFSKVSESGSAKTSPDKSSRRHLKRHPSSSSSFIDAVFRGVAASAAGTSSSSSTSSTPVNTPASSNLNGQLLHKRRSSFGGSSIK